MAFPTALRDRAAAGHLFLATTFGKQIDIYDNTSNPVTGWTNLYAICRSLKESEQEKFSNSAFVVDADKVFEVARQGSFVGTTLQVQFHKVKYDGFLYEIQSIASDDAEILTGGHEDAAVFVLYCKKLTAGRGEMAV